MRNVTRQMTIAVALATVALIVPSLALAFSPPRPASGKWKVAGGGGFSVSKDQKSISGFHVKPSALANCGTAEISVLGTHKLRVGSRGGVSNWIVGKGVPRTGSGLIPIKVTVRQAGKTTAGTFYLIFAVGGFKRDNDGSLSFGSCQQMTFTASK